MPADTIRRQYGVTSNNRPRLKTIGPNGKVRSKILPMPPLPTLLEGASGAEEMERLVQVYARGRTDGRRAARRDRGRLLAALIHEGVHHTTLQNACDWSGAHLRRELLHFGGLDTAQIRKIESRFW